MEDKYTKRIFKNREEIVRTSAKSQVLNNIVEKIKSLEELTVEKPILSALGSIRIIIADAYNINMYKFQLKLLSNVVNKELDYIESVIKMPKENCFDEFGFPFDERDWDFDAP